jgi:hypothetical protein
VPKSRERCYTHNRCQSEDANVVRSSVCDATKLGGERSYRRTRTLLTRELLLLGSRVAELTLDVQTSQRAPATVAPRPNDSNDNDSNARIGVRVPYSHVNYSLALVSPS